MGVFHMKALAIGIAAGGVIEHVDAKLAALLFGNPLQLLGRLRRPHYETKGQWELAYN